MRSFIILAAGLAAFTTMPASAKPGIEPAGDYRAWYEPQRDVYCLHLRRPTPGVNPRPSFRGVQCRSAAHWSMRGLRFGRPAAAMRAPS